MLKARHTAFREYALSSASVLASTKSRRKLGRLDAWRYCELCFLNELWDLHTHHSVNTTVTVETRSSRTRLRVRFLFGFRCTGPSARVVKNDHQSSIDRKLRNTSKAPATHSPVYLHFDCPIEKVHSLSKTGYESLLDFPTTWRSQQIGELEESCSSTLQ